MRGDLLPNGEHVAHYCKPSSLDEDGLPTSSSFMPRTQRGETEPYISLFWLEKLGIGSLNALIASLRAYLGGRPTGELVPATTGKYAAAEVGHLLSMLRSEYRSRQWSIRHEPRGEPPNENDPHSGLYGLTSDAESEEIAELIAQHMQAFPVEG